MHFDRLADRKHEILAAASVLVVIAPEPRGDQNVVTVIAAKSRVLPKVDLDVVLVTPGPIKPVRDFTSNNVDCIILVYLVEKLVWNIFRNRVRSNGIQKIIECIVGSLFRQCFDPRLRCC